MVHIMGCLFAIERTISGMFSHFQNSWKRWNTDLGQLNVSPETQSNYTGIVTLCWRIGLRVERPLTMDESKSVDSQYVPWGGYSSEGNVVPEYIPPDSK